MLFDVLGWDPTIVEAEKWTQAVGYLDYMFGPEPFSMVLEAKRDEINFVLPDKEYPSVPNAINLSSFPLVFQ